MAETARDWARVAGTMLGSHGTRFVEVSAERAVLEPNFKPELTDTGRLLATVTATQIVPNS
jgi:hypothetical protein